MTGIVPSPCVSICSMNDQDICIGCHRNSREIREWMLMDDAERHQVIESAFQRAKKDNPFY
ncbi:MAG: DUF1289 domain-containing protein [Porticoccus sp.]|jgi:predicted Fe-S protein YdhL (DUF1289 family)|nr:DUF1289 domain-containing protein [Porticoccus sp.]